MREGLTFASRFEEARKADRAEARDRGKPFGEKRTEELLSGKMRQAFGAMPVKITSQYHRGLPDRLFVLPNGKVAWAEIKTTGKSPTPLQRKTIDELTSLGHLVRVVEGPNTINAYLHEIQSTYISGQGD